MRVLVLLVSVLVSLASSSAFAASYQQVGGTIVDPIQCWSGCVGDHPYSGINLEPGIALSSASLSGADLRFANLSNSVSFSSNLSGVNLSRADLTGLILVSSDLTGTDLTGANLTNSLIGTDLTGSLFYNIYTDFTGAQGPGSVPFGPVAAGWTLVPEPSTALLLGLGLTALAVRRGE